MKINPEHVAWSGNLFRSLSDHGVWGVPRSGLIFQKQGSGLVLIYRMPHSAEMPITAEQLRAQQDQDCALIRQHFEAAGVTVQI